MKILFISRAHHPVIGGLESHNDALRRHLSKNCTLYSIVNRYGKTALPWFLPWALLRATMHIQHVDVVLLGDGVASTIGWILKKLFPGKPVCCVIHGLDVTYSKYGYQYLVVKKCLRSMDHYIAVSDSTRDVAIQHGLASENISVIGNGIELPVGYPKDRSLRKKDNMTLDIITVGRLVPRKGIAWFIDKVMPKLHKDVTYTVIGDGPEREHIQMVSEASPAASRIHLLGQVSDKTKWQYLQSSDLFIQPNIIVPNDKEGFGIVVLEACILGTPVLASRLEGLKSSVHEGKNGWLVTPSDADAFAQKINELCMNRGLLSETGKSASLFVNAQFGWDKITKKYLNVISSLINSRC